MAPVSAVAAAATQKQARRSVARIIPAIPHRFSRPPAPARPITPDESTTAAVAQSEPQPTAEKEPDERAATPVQTPLTPDSKTSAVDNGHVDESALASSPARSGDDHVEVEAVDVPAHVAVLQQQDIVNETPSVPQLELETAGVNGSRPQPSVPTELPPEFYPSEKPASRTPSVEGIDTPFRSLSTNLPIHRIQPSVEGLVFGGATQESPAIPSTPQEMESDVLGQQQNFARPLPGFAPHLAPQFFPGHTHHPSDPTAASWLYPAYTMAPPPETMYNGHDYHTTAIPAVAPAYHAPYQGQFSPPGASLVMNGATRSHSQSPNKSQFGEEPQAIPFVNGNASHHHESSHDGYDISKHMFSLFGNPEFTDYILHIRSPDTLLLNLPVHAALVSRSPVILDALRRSAPPGYRSKDSRRLLDVLTNDRFVTPESLHEALKILYGAPLLPVQSFLYGLGPYDSGDQGHTLNEARKRMSQAISYAAAGNVLQIPEMQICGMRIAKALLRWDTLDQVFQFGFEAGNVALLLDAALEFIAYSFPMDFSLYTLAPEMRHHPRLPTLVDSKQTTHNPRLSKIRFGDAPPEDDLMPSPIAQVLSSVLLSLPLPLLDRLFSHPAAANLIGWSGLVQVMRDVIEERESRRLKTSKGQLKPSSNGTVPGILLENLQREERVEPAPGRPSGYKLTAKRLADHA